MERWWEIVGREILLTDAVLRTPLTGKEAEKDFLTFDTSNGLTSLPGLVLVFCSCFFLLLIHLSKMEQ